MLFIDVAIIVMHIVIIVIGVAVVAAAGIRLTAIDCARVWQDDYANLVIVLLCYYYINKKLSYCWETVRCDSMPRIAEMDVEMTT